MLMKILHLLANDYYECFAQGNMLTIICKFWINDWIFYDQCSNSSKINQQ